MTRVANQQAGNGSKEYQYIQSYSAFVPAGCSFPVFANPGKQYSTPNTMPSVLADMFPKQMLNPYALFCVHVPLAFSPRWRERLIPEYKDGGCWVTPRITIRPGGKHGHMLLTAVARDLDAMNVYEGFGELTMASRSNPERFFYEPKQTAASHLFDEHQPTMAQQSPRASTSTSRIVESISSIRNLKRLVSGSKDEGAVPFNIRYHTLDTETGFVQNLVITGDDDDDVLILTRLRKPLYDEGASGRVLTEIISALRSKLQFDPKQLEFSMVEEALVRSASPPVNEFLTDALEREWLAQRQSITDSFRTSTLQNIQESLGPSFSMPQQIVV